MCQLTPIHAKMARRRRLRVRRLRCSWPRKTKPTLSGEENSSGDVENSSSDQSPTLVSSPDCLSETELVLCGAGDKEKESDSPSIVYSSVSITGRRREMEDEVSVELKFATKDGAKFDFFSVYDGHGGAEIARICQKRLHRVVAEEIEGEKGKQVGWERMMEKCFGRMDDEVIAGPAALKTVGSTAVLAVVGPEEVVVANCGDCRAVLARNGASLALSNDHKPDRADEMERIEAAGGKVINWNGCRVLGVLATSRSIGDEYLKPFVISKPEVTVTKRTSKDEFLILGSDGLWDVVSNDLACQVVRRVLGGHRRKIASPTMMPNGRLAVDAATVLAELAIAKGSGDNISVIVVELQKPSKEEFLILGSDGLWDVVSNDLACQVVRKVLGGHRRKIASPTTMPNGRLAVDAATALVKLAIAKGSRDNISAMVVELQKPSNFYSL